MSTTPSPRPLPWIQTPLIESAALSKAAGCTILLKLDLLQPSGSFKSRGIGHYLLSSLCSSPSPNHTHFYSSSGGNAGLAAIHAARTLGRPCSVVVPLSTKPSMVAKLHTAGASSVVQYGASWQEADAHLRTTVLAEAEARGERGVYVPPFDHADIWTGHATMIEEISAQMEGAPDVVVCTVGGGGLLNGIVQGIEGQAEAGWRDTQVLAVETRGADSLGQSVKRGEHVTLDAITSVATSLGAVRVCDRTYEIATTKSWVRSVVLGDDEAGMGCWRLAEDERLIVEPACGVGVAVCYGGRLEKALGRKVRKEDRVVVVVCGGSAVSVEQIAQYKAEHGCLGDEVGQGEEMVPSAVSNNVGH